MRRATASYASLSATVLTIGLGVFGLSLSPMAAADRVKPTRATASAAAIDSQPITREVCETGCTGAIIRCIQYTTVSRDRCDARAAKAYEKCLTEIKTPEPAVQLVTFSCDAGSSSKRDDDADQPQ